MLLFYSFSRFNFKELFRIDIVLRCHGKSYDICNRSYFISFTFRNSNEKSMTSLIADVLLLVITLSGVLRGLSSNIENLLPLIGAKSFAFGRIEGTQTSQLYGFTLLVVEGILFLVFIMVVEKIQNGREEWQKYFQSYRQKYSLKPVKYQITIQSF